MVLCGQRDVFLAGDCGRCSDKGEGAVNCVEGMEPRPGDHRITAVTVSLPVNAFFGIRGGATGRLTTMILRIIMNRNICICMD